jgi:phage-related minor tail protein
MAERTVSIKITSDGRAFVADQAGNAQAAQQLGQQLQATGEKADAMGQKLEGVGVRARKSGNDLTATGQDAQTLAKHLGDVAPQAQRAEQAIERMGISAKQQAAALRGVPAQFTDIFTSIAAGQSPMTVFLQQGGQLKDMFGGTGPAARALGGYVMGLVNPFTLAAAAVGVLGYSYIKGAGEATEYSTAIIMSGNAAGTTAAGLAQMAANIDGVIGTQAKAAEGLVAFAASGAVASDSLEKFTRIAIQMEEATGQAVEDTVKQFESLAKEPLKATIKLNEKYNYLTEAVYKQIKALDEQGKTTEAAKLAQDAFANATDVRTKQILANLGLIERGWNGIKKAVKEAGDAMLDVGRAATALDKISSLEKDISARQERNASLGIKGGKATEELQQRLDGLREAVRLEDRSAKNQAAANEQVKARIVFDEAGSRFTNDKLKLEREIVKARNEGLAAGASEVEIAQRVKNIRESYAKKDGNKADQALARAVQADVAGIKAAYELAKNIVADGLDRIDSLRQQGVISEYNATQQKSALRLQDIETQRQTVAAELEAVKKRKDSAKEQAELLGKLAVLEQQANNERAKTARNLDEQLVKPQLALVASTLKSVESVEQQAIALELQNEVFGKGKAALLDLTLAQLEHQRADLQATDNVIPGYIEALERQIAAVTRLRNAQGNAEGLDAAKKARDQAEQDERKEAKRLADELQKTAERWSGELMKGVKSFRKFLVDELKREAIKILIQPVLTQGIQSLLGGGSGGGIVGSIVNSVLGTGSGGGGISGAISSIFGGSGGGGGFVSNVVDGVAGLFGIGAAGGLSAAAGTSVAVGAAGSAAVGGLGFSGAATGGVGFAGSAAAAGGAAAGGGAAAAGGGFGAALSAIPVWGWIALGIGALASLSGGGETRSGQQLRGIAGTPVGGPSGGAIGAGAYSTAYATTQASINDTFRVIGSGARIIDYRAGIESSTKGKGFAYAGGALALADGSHVGFGVREGDGYLSRRGSYTPEQAEKAGAEELKRSYLLALQAASKTEGRLEMVESGTRSISTPGREDGDLPTTTTVKDYAIKQMMSATEIAAAEATSDVPKIIRDMLRNTLVEGLDSAGIDSFIGKIQNLIKGVEGLKNISQLFPFENLKNLSFDAAGGLIQLADALDAVDGNGLETLTSSLSTYFQNFYSAEENRRQAATLIQAKVNAAGGNFSVDNILDASRDDFRKEVDRASKLTDDAGKKYYLTLLSVAGAFAQITPATQQGATALADINKKLVASLREFVKDLPFANIFPDNSVALRSPQSPAEMGAYTAAVAAARQQSEAFALSLINLADSLDTVDGNGLETLTSGLSAYFTNFYSAEEQRLQKAKNIQRVVNGAGGNFSLNNILGASREQFRAEVERASKLTDEAGKMYYVALLSVAQTFADITPAFDAAADAAAVLTKSLQDQAEAAERARQAAAAATNASVDAVKRAINAERERVAVMQQLAEESVRSLRSTLDLLNTNARELRGQSDGGRNMFATEGLDFIDRALATAQTSGYMPDDKDLGQAIGAARGGLTEGDFTSQFAFDRQRLVLAGKLAELGGLAGTQLTTAEQQLEAANAQLKQLKELEDGVDKMVASLNGVDLSVTSVADAIDRLAASLTRQTGFGLKPTGVAGTPFTVGGSSGAVGTAGTVATASGTGNISGTGFLSTPLGLLDFRGIANSNLADPQYLASLIKQYKLTLEDVVQLMGYDKVMGPGYVEGYFAQAGIKAFARGGLNTGLAMVGEEGPELVDFKTPGRIYSASNTQAMLSGTRSVSDMQQMYAVINGMQAQSAKAVWLVDRMETILDKWDREGLPVTNFDDGLLEPRLKVSTA